ncbi:MAG: helix-turn-helix domain-containing protein [Fimbriimonas sp.]
MEGSFGAKIREARVARRISVRKLAKVIGISPTYLSHIEIDRVPPPAPDKVERLAHELGLESSDLMRLSGRWEQHAAEAIGASPKLRELFTFAFAMDEKDLDQLLEAISSRQDAGEGTLFS